MQDHVQFCTVLSAFSWQQGYREIYTAQHRATSIPNRLTNFCTESRISICPALDKGLKLNKHIKIGSDGV